MADDDAPQRKPGITSTGFTLPDETVEELDKIKRRWDDRESDSISRSHVAREALPLGLIALTLLDEEYDKPTTALTTRDKEAIVRQALLDFFDGSEDA